MSKYRIGWLPGDGVGNDVMEAGKIILDKINLNAEYIPGDVGWEFWCKEGNPLPARTIEMLKTVNCTLFGAITSKPKEEAEKELATELQNKGYVYSSPIVRLRQLFNLYINQRPCKAYPGNPLVYREDINLIIFRENTEGLYSGIEYHPLPDEVYYALIKTHPKMKKFGKIPQKDLALSCRIFSREACRKIVNAAFKYANEHNCPSVTVIEKPNVIRETSGLMIREARKIAQKYPHIQFQEVNVDAMAMWLIKNPQKYSVLVTSNMFGDIISDLCAQLVGGLGFAASGNIGENFALFEPTHGSAPKYAGQYKVNPTAMILSIKMMLDYLGETGLANKLESAIAETLREGKVRTYDMGGNSSTLDMAEEIASKI